MAHNDASQGKDGPLLLIIADTRVLWLDSVVVDIQDQLDEVLTRRGNRLCALLCSLPTAVIKHHNPKGLMEDTAYFRVWFQRVHDGVEGTAAAGDWIRKWRDHIFRHK